MAQAKGLPRLTIIQRHILPNAAIPVLTIAGASLRYSLASLPVVEYFFAWPGVGLTLLEAIRAGEASLVTDLILSLGAFFLLLNLLLEMIFPRLDPRLRSAEDSQSIQDALSAREIIADWVTALKDLAGGVMKSLVDLLRLPGRRQAQQADRGGLSRSAALQPGPAVGKRNNTHATYGGEYPAMTTHAQRGIPGVRNPALWLGIILALFLVSIVVFGNRLSPGNPYEIHGIMKIDDQINAPPFRPSPPFPWGSDQIGRDVQALVLWGARQTLTLALFGMLARLLVGTMLGLIAGWQSGSRLDRLITGAIDVWAAFPAVLLAMLVIQALGIQQGMGVFVAALAFVGWGEVAQFVREQVRTIQPQLYIEAARSTGASPLRILQHEVLPNLLPALVVLGALEMGAVLLLLAELGFLNIFLGGGFKVEFQIDKITYFSDIPEWGALLANIRDWWRSYPWMAWYPSLAFLLSIMAFNLLGEGLRRLLEETPYNLTRLFNRYTLLILAALVTGLGWSLRATAPISIYQSQAEQFNTERAVKDVRALAGPELQGRESGTGGATAAALYIARQMELAGLFPAGEKDSYLQRLPCQLPHLADVPGLEVNDAWFTARILWKWSEPALRRTAIFRVAW